VRYIIHAVHHSSASSRLGSWKHAVRRSATWHRTAEDEEYGSISHTRCRMVMHTRMLSSPSFTSNLSCRLRVFCCAHVATSLPAQVNRMIGERKVNARGRQPVHACIPEEAVSTRHRLKRPSAESTPWTAPTRFDEVQTKEKFIFKLRLNGSDHLFLSDFRCPPSARSGRSRRRTGTEGRHPQCCRHGAREATTIPLSRHALILTFDARCTSHVLRAQMDAALRARSERYACLIARRAAQLIGAQETAQRA
jgi:hypothetical protein